jgi:hypothetical protein
MGYTGSRALTSPSLLLLFENLVKASLRVGLLCIGVCLEAWLAMPTTSSSLGATLILRPSEQEMSSNERMRMRRMERNGGRLDCRGFGYVEGIKVSQRPGRRRLSFS